MEDTRWRTVEPSKSSAYTHLRLCHRSEGVPVITVCSYDVIIRTHRSDDTGHHRFLTNVKVTKATNLLRLVMLASAFLEPPPGINSISESISTSSHCATGCVEVRTELRGAGCRSLPALPHIHRHHKKQREQRSRTSGLRKKNQLSVALFEASQRSATETAP